MKKVNIILLGGLGNQLFQMFAAFAYGIQNKRKVIFPYQYYLPGVLPAKHIGTPTSIT